MTLRGFGSLAVWMLVLTSTTDPALAQSTSQDTPRTSAIHPVELTTFMSHDSALRWRFGVAIGFAWTSLLNVEAEINTSTGINQVQADELGASASLWYSLPRTGRLLPYVAGGAGLEQYRGPGACPDECKHARDFIQGLSRAVALNVGGGLKIPIAKNLSFRADGRWLNGLGRDADDHWRVYSGVTFRKGAAPHPRQRHVSPRQSFREGPGSGAR